MPSFGRVARHIQQLIDADPANADRIRDLLPAPTPAAKPAPRKRVTKATTTQAKPQL